MTNFTLESPVSSLNGVGPAIEKGLRKLKIFTVRDLLEYYPRRWNDFSVITKLKDIKPGPVAVCCSVEHVNVRSSHRNKRLTITEAILTDGTGTIKAVWFNQPFLANVLKTDQRFLFAGNFEFKNGYLSLNNPTYETATEENYKGKIFSVYSETEHINSKLLQKLVAQVIDFTSELSDGLPHKYETQNQLLSFGKSVENLHFPESMKLLEKAKARVGFGELFELVVAGLQLKAEIKSGAAPQISFNEKLVKDILKRLNFKLTNAQRKATWQILKDLDSQDPMNRLLQGDVGSGKTLVALIAAAMTVKEGFQVAIMAPTEILARQHLDTFRDILGDMNIRIELLISAIKVKEKKELHADIADNKVNIVIGTHALISQHVEFDRLGLVVIDEQHRFGVKQRRELKSKSAYTAHALTMTATPIPRSLALVVYGDLDVSVIDELPPTRKPVETKVVKEIDRNTIYFYVDQLLAQGQQAFVVCPSIEIGDNSDMKSVKSEYNKLQKTVFSHRKIVMLHGKLSSDEKTKIMKAFKEKKADILIATTVVEVGVDVPNANILLIENADRFGLATLHQLRGRVGRGAQKAYCYLFSESSSPNSIERLSALEKTNDGFRLAQIDLELRGPGEIYGKAQHGILDLRFANIFDTALLSSVKQTAKEFLSSSDMLKYTQLLNKVESLKNITSLD